MDVISGHADRLLNVTLEEIRGLAQVNEEYFRINCLGGWLLGRELAIAESLKVIQSLIEVQGGPS